MPTYFLILFSCSYCSSLSLLQLRHKSLLWFPSPCHFLHSTSNSATVVSLSPVEVILKRNLFTRWILHHRRRQRETANYLICKDDELESDRKTEDTHTMKDAWKTNGAILLEEYVIKFTNHCVRDRSKYIFSHFKTQIWRWKASVMFFKGALRTLGWGFKCYFFETLIKSCHITGSSWIHFTFYFEVIDTSQLIVLCFDSYCLQDSMSIYVVNLAARSM